MARSKFRGVSAAAVLAGAGAALVAYVVWRLDVPTLDLAVAGLGVAVVGLVVQSAVRLRQMNKRSIELATAHERLERRLEDLSDSQLTRSSLQASLEPLLGTLRRISREQHSATDAATRTAASVGDLQRMSEVSLDEYKSEVERLRLSLANVVRDEIERASAPRGAVWRVVRDESTALFGLFEALAELHRLLDLAAPLPSFGGWAIRSDTGLHLAQHVLSKRPRTIVDAGSGLSTIVLAAAVRANGEGHVVSLDHLPEYAAETRQHLVTQGLEEWATVYAVDLVDTEVDGETYRWYDLSDVPLPATVDMLFVDGPPGPTGPLARYPAVPMLRNRLADDATVVLDDAYRRDEREIYRRWGELLDVEPAVLPHLVGTAELTLSVRRGG